MFARLSGTATQFLVYQMSYESPTETAMILPIPLKRPARDSSLRFIDLQEYEEFFDDLNAGFPYIPPSFSIGCSSQSTSAGGLEVFQVGNYVASFVPSLVDFERLDNRFVLPSKTWDEVPQYADFGFAVFQLAAGSLKPHPMAFEFETNRNSIYFPTMHIHDGSVHKVEAFDHVLYLQHAGFDSRVYGYQSSNVADKSTGLVRSVDAANRFCNAASTKGILDGDLLVHRHVIRGNKPNQDTEIPVTGDPLYPSFNFRPWLSYTPWVLGVAAVAWLIRRRNRVKEASLLGK